MRAGPSKAFLLAAGLGERLKPLTDKTPKCLLPVGGRPILAWWLRTLEGQGVREVLINTHHLAAQVEAFAKAWKGALKITLAHEPELLGSAGTIAANKDFVRGDRAFWIGYADTLIGAELDSLIELHQRSMAALTMGLFRPPNPRACGVVEVDAEGKVLSFEEKPAKPRSDLAAAGVYLAGAELLDKVPAKGDLSLDVLPQLRGKLYGRLLEGPVLDMGTPAAYEMMGRDWDKMGFARHFAEVK